METLLNPPFSARALPLPAPAFDLEEFLARGALLGASPETIWVGWGEPGWSAEPARGRVSLYAPDFFLEAQRPWLAYPNQREISRDELGGSLRDFGDRAALSPALAWAAPDEAAFRGAFDDLQREFAAGRLRKAVPVVFERARARVDAERKRQWLASLLRNSRGLPVQPYGFWTRDEGMLGASPETLFELHSEGPARVLRTMALAGTRPSHAPERSPLLEDAKELEEHRIVVEGIAEAIREAGWGEPRAGELRELQLPTLSHLQTPLEVALARPVGFAELARVLHPTPALGAFPRVEGRAWLERQRGAAKAGGDRNGRRRFGAPFGVNGLPASVGGAPARCWVAIRNLQWESDPGAAGDEQRISLGAGCGIVPASEADREWDELALKIRSVKRFFDL